MKHFRRYIQASASVAVFAIMLTAAISSVTAEGRDYVYTHGGAGIAEPYKTTTWDISGIGKLDRIQRRKAPQYRVYQGPSQKVVSLSEIVDERCLRYHTDGIGTRWISEETSLVGIAPDSLCYTNVFDASNLISGLQNGSGSTPQPGNPTEITYTAHGRYCNNAFITEQGVYSCAAHAYGHIILESDTIDAIMTVESRRYIADLSLRPIALPMDAIRDSLEEYTVTRYRWYSAAHPGLPIAVQTDISSRYVPDNTNIAAISALYSIAPESIRELRISANKDNAEKVAANIEARYNAGDIILSINPGMAFDLKIGISNLIGIPYYNNVLHIATSAETREITIPKLPILPSGRYILGLGIASSSEISNKQYIIVP